MLDEKITKSRSVRQLDEIIFSSGTSRVTVPDELNEILQYSVCSMYIYCTLGLSRFSEFINLTRD